MYRWMAGRYIITRLLVLVDIPSVGFLVGISNMGRYTIPCGTTTAKRETNNFHIKKTFISPRKLNQQHLSLLVISCAIIVRYHSSTVFNYIVHTPRRGNDNKAFANKVVSAWNWNILIVSVTQYISVVIVRACSLAPDKCASFPVL